MFDEWEPWIAISIGLGLPFCLLLSYAPRLIRDALPAARLTDETSRSNPAHPAATRVVRRSKG